MSLYMAKPSTPPHLLSLSKALSDFVNSFDMAPKRDIVVYCFDATLPSWETEPAAWHRPTHGDIVLNLGVACKSIAQKKHDSDYGGAVTRPYEDQLSMSVNGGLVLNSIQLRDVVDEVRKMTREGYSPEKYHTYDSFGSFNRRPVTHTHYSLGKMLSIPTIYSPPDLNVVFARTIMAMLIHETAHAVFSQYITEPWFRKMNGYERQAMIMFEELRAEDQQLRRISKGTAMLRYAADVVVDPAKIAKDLREKRDEDGGEINVANFALNSTLTLGRLGYGIFFEREVKGLIDITTDLVGVQRYEDMHAIWKRFRDIRETNPDKMIACAEDWVKLFPSSSDGSSTRSSIARMPEMPGDGGEGETETETSEGDPSDSSSTSSEGGGGDSGDYDSTPDDVSSGSGDEKSEEKSDSDGEEKIDLPGLPDSLEDEMKKASDTAEDRANDTNPKFSSKDRTPSRISYEKAKHTKGSISVTRQKPSAADLRMASKLASELENLNLTERGKFIVPSETPPGRLRPRAMVSQAADRAHGRTSTAKPFKRTKHVHDLNPPLTAGIMTDVSGSQSWASMFSARTAFILSRAISSINGTVAAATFGDNVQITVEPGEHPNELVIIPADGGTEQFDHCAGTLDTMLRLTTGSGIRILFVVTDGAMVKSGEMRRTAAWVDAFHKAGVSVIWITPVALEHTYQGYPATPRNATGMKVSQREVSKDPSKAINQVARLIKKSFADRKH